MIIIKILHVISGNDNGGGANHVLNICKNDIEDMECEIACIGEGHLYNKARELGIPAVCISLKGMLLGKLVHIAEKNKIDIINFHGAKSNFIYLFTKGKIKIPSVATIHSDYRYDFLNNKAKKYMYTPLSKAGLMRFENYICVSNFLKDLLHKEGFKGEKYVVPNGIKLREYKIETAEEELKSKYNITKEDFVYIMVARMHPIKNHIGLINAFYKLSKEYKNIKLLLVGDGEIKDKLMETVDKLNLKDKVIFVGFAENVLDYINISHISLLSSFNEGGAPPLTILESALVKRTVISSAVGDMPYIIKEDNGFLVNPNLEDDIYEKMKKAYLIKENLGTMGKNLHDYVWENYSIEKFWKNYYNAYKHILTGVK